MQIDTDKMAQQLIDTVNDKIKNLKTLNIIIIGKSGVGKSTLINTLFRGNFAETGLGRPVTSEIRKLSKKDYPLSIYDTPGFERNRPITRYLSNLSLLQYTVIKNKLEVFYVTAHHPIDYSPISPL